MIAAALLTMAQPATEVSAIIAAREVIAAERTFAARAQSEGQWTAFRATAAPNAIMLTPGPTPVPEFLANFDRDPPVSVMWWPARVWVSCDGSLAVTTGPWVRRGGTQVGSFTTVWQRQPGGGWRWVYDNGRDLPAAIDAPDEPAIEEGYCGGQPARIDRSLIDPPPIVQFEGRAINDGRDELPAMRWGAPAAGGHANDRSLTWEIVPVTGRGANAYAFRLSARTRNHQRTALIEFHGLEGPAPR